MSTRHKVTTDKASWHANDKMKGKGVVFEEDQDGNPWSERLSLNTGTRWV